MGYPRWVWFATWKACAFAVFFGFMGLYFAREPPGPLSITILLVPIVLTLGAVMSLGGMVARALQEQAQRIERLERLLAERNPGLIAENPVTR
jgi:hypothetical protein